jgi:tRNA (guanine-N7-)-methyltransferase
MSARKARKLEISKIFSFSLMTNFTQQDSNPSNASDAQATAPILKDAPSGHHGIRSYVRRQGKMTVAQRRALETLSTRWICPFDGVALNFKSIFSQTRPVVLEIGFGMGETTAQIAIARPDTNFLGIEVYDAGVGSLMRRAEKLGLKNLKIVRHDAVAVVRDGIASHSLSGVHVFFPDPWPKKRHHKRRLLQPAFVALLADRLESGAYLHVATDWPDYAAQILQVLSQEPLLSNTDPSGGFCCRPGTRPLTKFEQRGIRLGNPVADLIFQRRQRT